jgi:DNA-binding MarR family transcriptional regulator
MGFFDALVRYETELWATTERALRAAGAVSPADLGGLRAIAENGEGTRVHDVSRALGITIGAASKLVDRLERAGLARRTANPADGRSSILELTRDGRVSLTEGDAVVRAVIAAHVPGAEADDLTERLEALRARLSATAVAA